MAAELIIIGRSSAGGADDGTNNFGANFDVDGRRIDVALIVENG